MAPKHKKPPHELDTQAQGALFADVAEVAVGAVVEKEPGAFYERLLSAEEIEAIARLEAEDQALSRLQSESEVPKNTYLTAVKAREGLKLASKGLYARSRGKNVKTGWVDDIDPDTLRSMGRYKDVLVEHYDADEQLELNEGYKAWRRHYLLDEGAEEYREQRHEEISQNILAIKSGPQAQIS